MKPLNKGQLQDNESVLYSEVSFFRGSNIISIYREVSCNDTNVLMRQNQVIWREVPVLMIFLHAVVSLWPHESFDKRHEHREDLFKNNEDWRETGEREVNYSNCLCC